jgi:hypothetical protein
MNCFSWLELEIYVTVPEMRPTIAATTEFKPIQSLEMTINRTLDTIQQKPANE